MRKLAYIIYGVLFTVAVVILAMSLFRDYAIPSSSLTFNKAVFWNFALLFLVLVTVSSIIREVAKRLNGGRLIRWSLQLVELLLFVGLFMLWRSLPGPRLHVRSSHQVLSLMAGAFVGGVLSTGFLSYLAGTALVARGLLVSHWLLVGVGLLVLALSVVRDILAKGNKPEEERVWQPGQSLDIDPHYRELMHERRVAMDLADGYYDVVLVTPGQKDVKTAKKLSDVFVVGLADAKSIVASVPQLLIHNADAMEAAGIRMLLNSTGAELRLERAEDQTNS